MTIAKLKRGGNTSSVSFTKNNVVLIILGGVGGMLLQENFNL